MIILLLATIAGITGAILALSYDPINVYEKDCDCSLCKKLLKESESELWAFMMTKIYAESVAHTSAIPTTHNAQMRKRARANKSMPEYPARLLTEWGILP